MSFKVAIDTLKDSQMVLRESEDQVFESCLTHSLSSSVMSFKVAIDSLKDSQMDLQESEDQVFDCCLTHSSSSILDIQSFFVAIPKVGEHTAGMVDIEANI